MTDVDREIWEQWKPWLAAVTGHHGDFYEPTRILTLDTEKPQSLSMIGMQGAAFANLFAHLFLAPVGLGLQNSASVYLAERAVLAGWFLRRVRLDRFQHGCIHVSRT